MRIYGITLDEFRRITEGISLTKYGGNVIVHQDAHEWDTPLGKRRAQARLAVRSSHGSGARLSWRGRHVPAACWHAYRDVLLAAFERHPTARIHTREADYVGLDGFLTAFPVTARHNIGSAASPVTMPELCECDERSVNELQDFLETFRALRPKGLESEEDWDGSADSMHWTPSGAR